MRAGGDFHHDAAARKCGYSGISLIMITTSASAALWFAVRITGRFSGNFDMAVTCTRR